MSIAQELKKLPQTPYQQIATRHDVSVDYVGKIARGLRKPKRGKGLVIKKELKKIIKKNKSI